MKRRLASLVVAVVASGPVHGAGDRAKGNEAEVPSAGFLEFLGEWEDDGEWVDPMNFEVQGDEEHDQEVADEKRR